jgi:hypothetical protein
MEHSYRLTKRAYLAPVRPVPPMPFGGRAGSAALSGHAKSNASA